MARIRENTQKQLRSHDVDTQLLRTGRLGTVRMFVCIINVLGIKEPAP
ncbi:MAG: hypothetical protein ACYSSI_11030 [Planctomycetota bacterium]|jgi:hypothetical protein